MHWKIWGGKTRRFVRKAAILYTPLGNFFKAVPLAFMPWGILIGTLVVSIVLAVLIARAVFMILREHGATEY